MPSELVDLLKTLVSLMNWTGLVAGLVSIALGLMAIWLSWLFFKASSEANRQSESLVSDIRAQVQILSRLNDKHLNRLTAIIDRSVSLTERSQSELRAIQNLNRPGPLLEEGGGKPANSLADGSDSLRVNIPSLPEMITEKDLFREYLRFQFVIYYYTVHVNYLASLQFQVPQDFLKEDELSLLSRDLLDRSRNDFEIVASILDRARKEYPDAVQSHPLFFLGENAKKIKELVHDFKSLEARRAPAAGDSGA